MTNMGYEFVGTRADVLKFSLVVSHLLEGCVDVSLPKLFADFSQLCSSFQLSPSNGSRLVAESYH